MNLLNAQTAERVRDADLVKRIAESQGIGSEFILRQCIREQERRDELAALPRDTRRRAQTRFNLEEKGGGERDDLRHIHSVLAICSLPYKSQPLAVREWERKQGKMSLMVTAGKLVSPEGQWVDQPLPYGSRARLLLLHTCSEAIRHNSPVIHIEDSLTGFIRSMGFSVTGGKNGSLNAFKQQVNALAACTMRIGVWNGSQSRTINTQPFSNINLWLPTKPDQRMLWPSTVTLSQEFFSTLTEHALPVNIHAVKAFAGSSRKLDLLYWMGYRLNNLNKTLHIPWESLREQFGAGYARQNNFRRDFAREIAEIKEVFPKLPVKVSDEGFTISPGTAEVLAIPSKPSNIDALSRISASGRRSLRSAYSLANPADAGFLRCHRFHAYSLAGGLPDRLRITTSHACPALHAYSLAGRQPRPRISTSMVPPDRPTHNH